MGLLRLAVLGPPGVVHDSSRLTFALRKAQALLLYLAVEGGLHSRSKLAALLWPDSEASDARRTLRNALGLLRSLLADPTPSVAPDSLSGGQGAHLLSQGELIGLNPQAPLELDLAVVQQAYTAAQRFSTPPPEPQRAALVAQLQQALALVRGPFLDGFWLREETDFDAWHEQQQWQVCVQLLCERLSSWQEAAGELEPARATLLRWLALDPLSEEAIGHYEQARALLKAQQPLQSRLSASEVEHLYVSLGRAYAFQNDWPKAQETYEELLAYAQAHQLPVLVSMTLNRLAILAAQQAKDRSQVQARLQQAWHMAEISHDQRTLAETALDWTQISSVVWQDLKRALAHGEQALALARAIEDQELEARSLSLLGLIHLLGGDFEEAIHFLEAALALYAALGHEPIVARELSLPSFAIGAPLTQSLTYRASEALCWTLLGLAQLQDGQVQQSIASSRRALALSKESKNIWTQVNSMDSLTSGLLEAGTYEEALGLMQHAVALARTLPLTVIFQTKLIVLGSVYHALQQWEEARAALEEAVVLAERLDLGALRVPALSRLCLHYAVAGQWEAASRYALQAIAGRKDYDAALIAWDFCSHYETEALLREGDERQAKEAVHRLGERLLSNRRFRIPYLRSLAVLADWQGHGAQAIAHLRQAAGLAADLGLPEEQWQIQAALGRVYQAGGEQEQARTAFGEAATIIQGLAEGLKDEALRARYLAGPQIQPVVQHAQRLANQVPKDHTEQSGQ